MRTVILKLNLCTLAFFVSLINTGMAEDVALPSFLPGYFAPVLNEEGARPLLLEERETNGVVQCIYSIRRNEVVSVEKIAGDAPACRAVFNNLLGNLNQLMTTNDGAFSQVTDTEFSARLMLTNKTQEVLAFVMPHSVNVWTHTTLLGAVSQFHPDFQNILSLVNRQRYEEAFKDGNVEMGQWQKSIRSHAGQLFATGKKAEALVVLSNLLATAAFDYQAHLQFLENAPDLSAATNSAKVVFKNAEDFDEISKAARFLGIPQPHLDKFAPMATNDTGLEVILIPIAPCNPWLLDDVARTYENITGVPVKIRRLDEEWKWNPSDRIFRQRDIEGALIRLAKTNIVFTGWNKDRYLNALTNAVKSEDALSKFWVNDLVSKVGTEPGQYRVDSYLEQLCWLVGHHRTKDARTMYVGITEANFYSGDNNFVFSLGRMDAVCHASLMSYYMMQGKVIPQGFDSRQRLVERMAKELVPASLKQLGIPRSTDPTCPYSYSSGLERLDQKTLNLSGEVKQALERFKNDQTP